MFVKDAVNMNIQQVCRETGLGKKAVYFYINEGIISPERDEKNGYFIFTDEQLQSIVMGQAERTVKKSHYVSIGTVGKENSKLLVIEPDSFKIVNSKFAKRDVMVGISFVGNCDSEQYDAILHPAVI